MKRFFSLKCCRFKVRITDHLTNQPHSRVSSGVNSYLSLYTVYNEVAKNGEQKREKYMFTCEGLFPLYCIWEKCNKHQQLEKVLCHSYIKVRSKIDSVIKNCAKILNFYVRNVRVMLMLWAVSVQTNDIKKPMDVLVWPVAQNTHHVKW